MKVEPDAEELSERVAEARQRLDVLVSQLDERRHVVTRVKAAMSDRPLLVAGGSLVAAALATGVAVLLVTRQNRRRSGRARGLLRALGRMTEKPERAASNDPTMGHKIATAVAVAVATTLMKKVGSEVVVPRLVSLWKAHTAPLTAGMVER